jgi:hypothetical protein
METRREQKVRDVLCVVICPHYFNLVDQIHRLLSDAIRAIGFPTLGIESTGLAIVHTHVTRFRSRMSAS